MKMTGLSSIAALPEERITDKISRRMASGERAMMIWWEMKTGAHVTAHSHPHEQMVWLIEGKMEFRVGTERRVCGPGDIAVIPSGVEHEGWVLEDSKVVDIFAPPREDFLAGQWPSYMAKK